MATTLSHGLPDLGRTGLPRLLPFYLPFPRYKGERKRTLGIVFLGCSPFDKLRANGREFWGSSSLAVRPSTGSGRTDCAHWGSSSPVVHPATGSGRMEVHFGIVFPGCSPFDRLRANGLRTLGIVFPGCSSFDRLRANGSAIWGSSSRAVRPSTGSGRTDYAVNGKAHTISVASTESPLRHRAEALCGIAQEPSEDAFRWMS